MALEGLPPWLQVSPRDFVLAAAQGAQLGHQIADSTMRAWEEQARMRMASQEAAARREESDQQHDEQMAMTRLAADRLEQYRQSEVANRNRALDTEENRANIFERNAQEKARHDLAREQTMDEAEKRKEAYRRVVSAGGGVYRINAEGPPEVLVPPKPPVDTELKDYERQLRVAQSGLDVAKKNVDKLSATKPKVNPGWPLLGSVFSGLGPSTNQVPVFKQVDTDKAKASLEAAQNALDEKKSLLDTYKRSKGVSGVVTHVYDPAGDTYNPVQPDQDLGD